MSKPANSHNKPEQTIANADVKRFADEAEHGYDVDALVARRREPGRPLLTSAPANMQSPRLDPEMSELPEAWRTLDDGTLAPSWVAMINDVRTRR